MNQLLPILRYNKRRRTGWTYSKFKSTMWDMGTFPPSTSTSVPDSMSILRTCPSKAEKAPPCLRTSGTNLVPDTIGREDITCPSTIQISGDPTISRRCASIDIEKSANGNALFFFTVIKSRNPIKVNGKELHDGEKLQLKFGDTIVMGKTSMVFTKK